MAWNPRNLNEMAAELGRVGSWAPGNYAGKCGACDREFMGDKRAPRCLPCAVSSLHERVAELSKIEAAARDLWTAHCKSQDTLPSPQKFGMNYGELLALGKALGLVETQS